MVAINWMACRHGTALLVERKGSPYLGKGHLKTHSVRSDSMKKDYCWKLIWTLK